MYVVPLSAVPDADPRSVGGKARSIGRMMRSGLPVPDGLCVTDAGLRDLSSADLEAELTEELRRLRAATVAVRSSAGSEDSSTHSYAGIFKSFLNVDKRTDAVIAALEGVRESADGPVVRAYERAVESTNPSMAAVVQEMIEPLWSGVMFTSDPVASNDHILIEATSGAVAAGSSAQPSPEYAAVDRAGSVVPGSSSPGFSAVRAFVDDLVAISRRCEQLFGNPQDIEWVWDGGRVWVLQSRTITTP
ncbi:PEP/pyruvate-binding domain-containing protein [Actinoplanes sp. NPDC049316]|uniref:PEP/pyruvate-binding domain-containing protein n=1 Tax=Actinoplanes sp. NPDC049316 TaxID=3154727 RepID=UPI00342C5D58